MQGKTNLLLRKPLLHDSRLLGKRLIQPKN